MLKIYLITKPTRKGIHITTKDVSRPLVGRKLSNFIFQSFLTTCPKRLDLLIARLDPSQFSL